ncbi:CotY/CotZ family spore coat protein [Pontibacillus salicampi]|uniref:CotY/CotZ family spore coat protein n=1 Tax=Pontibacillus salicampi TaxID=1449801 RepID=A0ABV6LLW0_9BACI
MMTSIQTYEEPCILDALLELKKQQEQLEGCPSDVYSSLLCKLLDIDTIPFTLQCKDSLLTLYGATSKKGKLHTFETTYFRIEQVHLKKKTATVSLLLPIDMHECVAKHHKDMFRLEKTNSTTVIDTRCICAIHCLDINLLKKIIIEPKW